MYVTDSKIDELSKSVDNLMDIEFENVNKMQEFHTGDWFNEDYYKRHILECVLRIHMNNEMDSRAVAVATQSNIPLAKMLSFYVYDELGHDEMFAQDLRKYGYTDEQVKVAKVFPSTMKLMGYMNFTVEKEGPMVAVVWDWFLEYYGDKFNAFITQKAGSNMGQEQVDGAHSHVVFDEEEDHHGMMMKMLSTVITNDNDMAEAKQYLKVLIPLVGEYFNELQQSTL